jgi:hypothetical protein
VFISPLRHTRGNRRQGGNSASVPCATAPRSSAPRRTPLPPVDCCTLTNRSFGDLGVGEVAELPQLLRGAAVLKYHLVGFEGIELTGTKPVNPVAHPVDKLGQSSLVILRNCLACGPPPRLTGHTSEATNPAAIAPYLDRHDPDSGMVGSARNAAWSGERSRPQRGMSGWIACQFLAAGICGSRRAERPRSRRVVRALLGRDRPRSSCTDGR